MRKPQTWLIIGAILLAITGSGVLKIGANLVSAQDRSSPTEEYMRETMRQMAHPDRADPLHGKAVTFSPAGQETGDLYFYVLFEDGKIKRTKADKY